MRSPVSLYIYDAMGKESANEARFNRDDAAIFSEFARNHDGHIYSDRKCR